MNEICEIKARVTYEKTHPACYIAHLDTIDIICKALRRLQLPYNVTGGCHIRPKISFGAPLPLGHASRCEQFVLSLSQQIDSKVLASSLNAQLPAGMKVVGVEIPCIEDRKGANGDIVGYRFLFNDNQTANQALEFLQNPETAFTTQSKGRERQYRIGSAVKRIAMVANKPAAAEIQAEFVQGLAEIPSVSKIVTALAEYLNERKEHLVLIERTSLIKL